MTGAATAETSTGRRPPVEIWLRGNPRPGLAVLAAAAAATAVAGIAMAVVNPPGWVVGLGAAAAVAGLAIAGGIAWSASRPRLTRRGDVLEVRLAPLGVHRVPLDLVECVFPGSASLGGVGEAAGDRRVGTLVLRLAERATDWRMRPVPWGWGEWDDGCIVLDGRWCEPLTQATARDVAARLLEARRDVASGGTP